MWSSVEFFIYTFSLTLRFVNPPQIVWRPILHRFSTMKSLFGDRFLLFP